MNSIKNNLQISFQPNKNDLDEIKTWLIDEQNSTGDGFYCNWSLIEGSFNDCEMVVIRKDSKPIGFATYYSSDVSVRIDIIEVIPSLRKMGIGETLLQNLFQHFIQKNKPVINLQCATESSETYWRKHGFIDFPKEHLKNASYRENKYLYKVIVPSLKVTQVSETENSVELWNCDPSLCKNQPPFSFWDIKQDINGDFADPIISPCQADWRLRITKEKIVVFDGRVKVYNNNLCRDGFLYLKSLSVENKFSKQNN